MQNSLLYVESSSHKHVVYNWSLSTSGNIHIELISYNLLFFLIRIYNNNNSTMVMLHCVQVSPWMMV